ncbi:carbohydrate kinase family protein [Paenibacillus sp. JDR-2]|uniref:carbohydrate kinase family protein n=1 Tax=Paenibacillus sp. (strain JDR-2) TaxID=324057 RepID=UPI00016649F7|nr:carbohydrate kinase [Paenibacillus sp. JDR-2]ACT03822.1 PfkB domain protein [Paenibacillus sp. JDR-2]
MAGNVVCIGELLIDFFCIDIDVDLEQGEQFAKKAGGAPANVSAAIARLGGSSAFVGKVGKDPFGHYLKRTLEEEKVDTSMLMLDAEVPTTLAFVSLEASGERDFVFNRGADRYVELDEIDRDRLYAASVLHFGSATALLDNPFRATYTTLLQGAAENGRPFISFDPNYRKDLWGGWLNEFTEQARYGASQADLVKVSEEELQLMTGETDPEKAVRLLHGLGANRVCVTLGRNGTLVSDGKTLVQVPSITVKSIDSTGAGDAFVGALLWQISRLEEPKGMSFEQLLLFVEFANKVGAIVCTKVGAIAALPTLEEVNRYPA